MAIPLLIAGIIFLFFYEELVVLGIVLACFAVIFISVTIFSLVLLCSRSSDKYRALTSITGVQTNEDVSSIFLCANKDELDLYLKSTNCRISTVVDNVQNGDASFDSQSKRNLQISFSELNSQKKVPNSPDSQLKNYSEKVAIAGNEARVLFHRPANEPLAIFFSARPDEDEDPNIFHQKFPSASSSTHAASHEHLHYMTFGHTVPNVGIIKEYEDFEELGLEEEDKQP